MSERPKSPKAYFFVRQRIPDQDHEPDSQLTPETYCNISQACYLTTPFYIQKSLAQTRLNNERQKLRCRLSMLRKRKHGPEQPTDSSRQAPHNRSKPDVKSEKEVEKNELDEVERCGLPDHKKDNPIKPTTQGIRGLWDALKSGLCNIWNRKAIQTANRDNGVSLKLTESAGKDKPRIPSPLKQAVNVDDITSVCMRIEAINMAERRWTLIDRSMQVSQSLAYKYWISLVCDRVREKAVEEDNCMRTMEQRS
jgi:hypothetical protein